MKVEISKDALKSLKKAPNHIVLKISAWVEMVEQGGIDEARRIPGYHDELLRGELKGKRSIRLSRQWRAIYSIKSKIVEFVLVEKVTPHEYKK